MGFNGSKIFCLHYVAMQTIDVPQSASLYRYLESKDFDMSYRVACLGACASHAMPCPVMPCPALPCPSLMCLRMHMDTPICPHCLLHLLLLLYLHLTLPLPLPLQA